MKKQNTALLSLGIHGGLAQIPNFADAQVLGIAWFSIFIRSKYSLPYTLNICRLLRIAQCGCYINSCCTILLGNKIKYLYILNPESNLFRLFSPFQSILLFYLNNFFSFILHTERSLPSLLSFWSPLPIYCPPFYSSFILIHKEAGLPWD